MNDINEMPPKCQYCPYWEVCEYPWVCPDREQLATKLQQTCSATDTISRQSALNELRAWREACAESGHRESASDLKNVIRAFGELPSAQSEQQKGEWIDYTENGYVECPFCHNATNCDGNKDELHFCFSCGADMREVE